MLVEEVKYAEKRKEIGLNALSRAIVKTLLYFDVFQYPLTLQEIYGYCSWSASMNEIDEQLNILEAKGYVLRNGLYYYINAEEALAQIERKIEGSKRAEKMLKTARRFSKFISFFPFVKGICLSGSLSKGYADALSDIDYFIITEPGKLWLCRTMLVFFKKFFLFNSHKYFCVNYFVDTNNLEIPDKNIFTATELVSIIPTYNAQLYAKLMMANRWTKEYFPNSELKNQMQIYTENKLALKGIVEFFFSDKLGDKLDDKCFRMTLKHWKKKFNDFDEAQFDLRLRSRKNVSKHHPLGFQEKVLKSYENNIKEYENKFNISLG
jgi:hypothetical protein